MKTHRELEELGAKFLSEIGYFGKCRYVVIDPMAVTHEKPDVLGYGWGFTHVIECKTNIGDFRRDQKKKWRINGDKPMGTYRWWMCESGLIQPEDLPNDGSGLLWVNSNDEVSVVVQPIENSTDQRNLVAELDILYTLLNKETKGGNRIYNKKNK